MLDRALIVEYWRDSDGRFVAEARHHPISATGASLPDLKENIAARIRESFDGGILPAVYGFVPRADDESTRSD